LIRLAAILLTVLCCSGCIALLHDAYFSPRSSEPHELRSPVRGHPAEVWTVFGSPSDILTIERDGMRIGLHAKNTASSFAWFGPLFIPLIPIPANETFEASPLEIWLGVVSDQEVGIESDGLRLRIVEDVGDAGREASIAPHEVRERVVREGFSCWDLVFLLPEGEPVESFDLEIAGLRTQMGRLAPAVIHFSLVEGWRAAALP
jgi:hypothetical protein